MEHNLVWFLIFRCLSITATENNERSKGRIANQENSGTEGVGVGVGLGEFDGCVV
jgi:hypothetical protein